ncbi:putative acyl-CoA dehydrogenase, middle domain protein [Mycobacterium xenopi 4042]|uniref:Putative acyl-CoA dehydrogenase, middle domain protein n=1 Tax=Mycobacterium xenopi 4042 TaxID=1299334 RepID=X8E3S4_MYCXE|nr:putative acyl-CoA dehydrogenase, middle domain protein [Mycobacterium xenopi 4042]
MGDQRRKDMEHQCVCRRLRIVPGSHRLGCAQARGLTMFLVPIDHPGITLRRITQLNGSTEFCEEFLDNVDVGDDAVVGEVNNGWTVASRQLYHERRAVGQSSEFASGLEAKGDARRRWISSLWLARPVRATMNVCRKWPAGYWCIARSATSSPSMCTAVCATVVCRRRPEP